MHPILGRTWTVNEASPSSPFRAGEEVEITAKAEVVFKDQLWPGVYDEARNRVTVQLDDSVRWELVGSGTMDERSTLFGLSWDATKPDALGSWVADPQNPPPPAEP